MDDTVDYASETQDRMQRAGAAETGSDLERFYLGAAQVYATLELARAVREATQAISELKEPVDDVRTAVADLVGWGEAVEGELDAIGDSLRSIATSLERREPPVAG